MNGEGLVVLFVVALLAACVPPPRIPNVDLSIGVTASATEVEFGKAFSVEVIRVWKKGLVPEEWNELALAPLTVKPKYSLRWENDGHVQETRGFDAYAFTLTDVSVPAPQFKALDGGTALVATGKPLDVRVKRSFDDKRPGPAELPGDLLAEPSRWRLWTAIGATVLIAVTALWLRRMRARRLAAAAPVPVAVTVPPPPAHERALQRIARLRERPPRTPEETDAWFVEASSVLRDYAGERFAVRAAEMTTRELVAATPVADAPRMRLADALTVCDLVKFACHVPSAAEHDGLLVTAETFVRETAA